jgi:uncharacterized membrane protein YfcA
MEIISILTVCIISFVISTIAVSMGGISLITIPALIWLGMAPKNAIATNMFALIFLSASGAVSFGKEMKVARYKTLAVLLALTILGSFIGANMVLAIDENILKRIIAVAMCIIAGSFFCTKDLGIRESKGQVSKAQFFAGSLLVFILGIYGGFFSGGYVTLLSYVLILTLGLSFLRVAFLTKILNVFSSFVACVFFHYHGLIDFSVGVPLAVCMSLGGFWGARIAVNKGNLWIRKVFVVVVIALAVKLLAF